MSTYKFAFNFGCLIKPFCNVKELMKQASYFKNGPFWPFFFIFVFSIQLTVNVHFNFLPMAGFELWTSGIGSNRSTDLGTTTAQASFKRSERIISEYT